MNTCANVTSKNVELFPVIQDKSVTKTQTPLSSYHLKCFMVTQCSQVTARKERDVYLLLRFIAVVSGGNKTDFNLNNIISSLSYSSGLYSKPCYFNV